MTASIAQRSMSLIPTIPSGLHSSILRISGLKDLTFGNSSPLQSGLNFIKGINLTLHNILLGQRPPCDGNQSIKIIIQHHINTTVSNISGSPHNSAVRVQFNNVFNVNITHIEPWYMCNNTRSEKVSCSCFSLQLVFVVRKGRVEEELRRREYFTLINQTHFCRRDPVSFTLGEIYNSNENVTMVVNISNSVFEVPSSQFGQYLSLLSFNGTDENISQPKYGYRINIENSTFRGTGLLYQCLVPPSSVLVMNSNVTDNMLFLLGNEDSYLATAVAIIPCLKYLTKDSTSAEYRFENVVFGQNMYMPILNAISLLPAVLMVKSTVQFSNCNFTSNRGTALYVQDSNILFEGNITFFNNTGYDGGAMVISGQSYVDRAPNYQLNTTVNFTGNHAYHTGGAILITTGRDVGFPECFLKSCNLHLHFHNNTAVQGGDDIYGGYLDQATNCNKYQSCNKSSDLTCFGEHAFSCIKMVHMISNFTNQSLSSVTSDPTRVCLCNTSGVPDCLNILSDRIAVYPGQTFPLSAVVVGQTFGRTTGSICPQIFDLNNTSIAFINSHSNLCQIVSQHSCQQLNLQISSNRKKEVLVLTTSQITVSEYSNEE